MSLSRFNCQRDIMASRASDLPNGSRKQHALVDATSPFNGTRTRPAKRFPGDTAEIDGEGRVFHRWLPRQAETRRSAMASRGARDTGD